MAKHSGQVRSQMAGGFKKPSMGGGSGPMAAPFDHPHSMGWGGIPVVMMDHTMPTVAAAKLTPTQTGGPSSAKPRPGTKQYPFGGSSE